MPVSYAGNNRRRWSWVEVGGSGWKWVEVGAIRIAVSFVSGAGRKELVA